ncbi:predicted protein [Chaetoceros tenuissimus]|uniref:Uncharacterized protein n=1 Tax=Chaetoceros tenuissimus TaxID=426638 RepID=A0AAD3HFD1_9STRA|nr:predicted protein [Chaetoceros tenuissimus]
MSFQVLGTSFSSDATKSSSRKAPLFPDANEDIIAELLKNSNTSISSHRTASSAPPFLNNSPHSMSRYASSPPMNNQNGFHRQDCYDVRAGDSDTISQSFERSFSGKNSEQLARQPSRISMERENSNSFSLNQTSSSSTIHHHMYNMGNNTESEVEKNNRGSRSTEEYPSGSYYTSSNFTKSEEYPSGRYYTSTNGTKSGVHDIDQHFSQDSHDDSTLTTVDGNIRYGDPVDIPAYVRPSKNVLVAPPSQNLHFGMKNYSQEGRKNYLPHELVQGRYSGTRSGAKVELVKGRYSNRHKPRGRQQQQQQQQQPQQQQYNEQPHDSFPFDLAKNAVKTLQSHQRNLAEFARQIPHISPPLDPKEFLHSMNIPGVKRVCTDETYASTQNKDLSDKSLSHNRENTPVSANTQIISNRTTMETQPTQNSDPNIATARVNWNVSNMIDKSGPLRQDKSDNISTNIRSVTSDVLDDFELRKKRRNEIIEEMRLLSQLKRDAQQNGDMEEVKILIRSLDLLNLELDKLHSSTTSAASTSNTETKETTILNESKEEIVQQQRSFKIRAPADLSEGYEFTANIKGEIIKAVVPKNVKKGEIFRCFVDETKNQEVQQRDEVETVETQSFDTRSFETAKSDGPKSILKRRIKIRAPTDLIERMEFSTTVNGTMVKSTVPKGGVRKGDIFSIPLLPGQL